MRKWKIERLTTFDDDELTNKIMEIESRGLNYKVQQIVYMGDNSQHVRIYQILFTIE
jgi:hypothetical protein